MTKPRARPKRNQMPFPLLGRPMRVLWCSDAPWATSGYSAITKQQAPALQALGVDIALLCTYGLHGARREWEGLPVYPGGADAFANDVIARAAADWKPDVVITLKDSFVFHPQALQGLRWLGMVPVDHEPLAPAIIERLRAMYRPIAYAPNGFRDIRAAGFDPLYAPHSYDPRVFYPTPKKEARAKIGLPADKFIVGTVAVNRGGYPSRKAWPQLIEAFSLFGRSHPDAMYFLHTDLAQDGHEGGVNIPYYASRYGCTGQVAFCDQERYRYLGFPEEHLRLFYSSLDVLLAVSLGEGFGIPQLEAQACGVPVITSGWCASEDLCFGGWKLDRSEALRMPDGQQSDVYVPFPGAIAEKLERAYAAREELPMLGKAARAGARAYELPHVMKTYWRPVLSEVERMIVSEHARGVLRIIRPEEVGIERAA